MANLSNINNKFLFTDGDFLKIGNLAPINNISGTESGISITNGNCASITLDNSAASGKTFVIYSAVNGSLNFFDADAASGRLIIDSSGNATFAGSISAGGISITTLTAANIQLNGSFTVLNKAQTSYLPFATRNTAGSEVVYDLTNAGNATFAGSIQSKATQSASTWIEGNGGGLNYGMDLFLTNDLGSTQGATRLRSAYGDIGTAGYPNFSISRSTTTQAYNSNPNTLTYSESLVINGASGNVGIGTASPGSKLTINETSTATAAVNIVTARYGVSLQGAGATSNSQYLLNLQSDGGAKEVMRVQSSGNVGIGTTSPGANLDVAGTAPVIRITNTTDPLGNGTVGSFEFFTNDSSTGATRTVSSIVCDNQAGSAVPGGDLVFKTSLGGSGSPVATEKMRIEADGNVGMGATNPAVRLDFGSATGKAFHLYTSGTDYYGFNMLQYDSGPFSTNIFSGNGGEIKLRTAAGSSTAVTRLTVKAAGNVGIGNNTPLARLTIGSSQGSSLDFSYDSGNGYRNNISNYWNSSVDTRMDFNIGRTANVAPVTVMSVGYNSNVGIGTILPGRKLEIKDEITTNGHIQGLRIMGNASNYYDIGRMVSGPLSIQGSQAGYNDIVLAPTSGDVGIGTTSPIGKLTVQGDDADIYLRSNDYTIARIINRGSSGQNLDTGLFSLMYSNTENVRIDAGGNSWFNGGYVGIGTTTPDAKLHVDDTAKDKKTMIRGNNNSQGFAQNITLVNQYPTVSAGTQLIIPFTSQGNLNSNTIMKIMGHSARFNASAPLGFTATIALGHLNALYSLAVLDSTGNISGVSTSGMNLIISFTSAYTYAVSDGIFATIEYMTNATGYSLQPANIVMN